MGVSPETEVPPASMRRIRTTMPLAPAAATPEQATTTGGTPADLAGHTDSPAELEHYRARLAALMWMLLGVQGTAQLVQKIVKQLDEIGNFEALWGFDPIHLDRQSDAFFVLSIVLCGGLWRWAKRVQRTGRLKAMILGFGVYGAWLFSAITSLFPLTTDSAWRPEVMLTWLVLVPLAAQDNRRNTMLAVVLSLCSQPFMRGVRMAMGQATPPPVLLVARFVMLGLGGSMALLPHWMVIRLGGQLDKTRERLQKAREEAANAGSYQLLRKLGEGGMGEVWEARHRSLARPAAIKLIRADQLGDPKLREQLLTRFTREALATARLQSPHTVDVYDFGLTEEGDFYYAMELLDGLDLDQLIELHGPIGPARAVAILIQLCDSLAEAHARSFSHRDIKPANVFICRYGLHCDWVKLLDFGLVLDRSSVTDRLTQVGSVQGSYGYLAPEVIKGDPADERVDIYAVGGVGWWLLGGCTPFTGKTPFQIMFAQVNESPKREQLTEHGVPEALIDVLVDCLAAKPEDRPASIEVIAERLRALELDDRWSRTEARSWWDRCLPPRLEGEDLMETSSAVRRELKRSHGGAL